MASDLARRELEGQLTDWLPGFGSLYCRLMGKRGRFADALPFLERRLAELPAYAERPEFLMRYDAARMAANTGTPELRVKALAWLTADLADWRELQKRELNQNNFETYCRIVELDGRGPAAGLGVVRDPQKLALLAADERAAWDAYWIEFRKMKHDLIPKKVEPQTPMREVSPPRADK